MTGRFQQLNKIGFMRLVTRQGSSLRRIAGQGHQPARRVNSGHSLRPSVNPTTVQEGRADRFGQPHDTVRTVTYYGGTTESMRLRLYLPKHERSERSRHLNSPGNTGDVIEALAETVLARRSSRNRATGLTRSSARNRAASP